MDVKDLRETGCLYRSLLCTGVGLVIALVYSGLATASVLWGEGRRQLNALALSLADMIALYVAIGVIGGVFVGIFLPIARGRIGAAALGFVVVAAYVASLSLLVSADLPFVIMIGLLSGPIGAIAAATIVWQKSKSSGQ